MRSTQHKLDGVKQKPCAPRLTFEELMAEPHNAWEVYEIGGKFFFDAQGPVFGSQTFGPYEGRDQAEVSMTECDAVWE